MCAVDWQCFPAFAPRWRRCLAAVCPVLPPRELPQTLMAARRPRRTRRRASPNGHGSRKAERLDHVREHRDVATELLSAEMRLLLTEAVAVTAEHNATAARRCSPQRAVDRSAHSPYRFSRMARWGDTFWDSIAMRTSRCQCNSWEDFPTRTATVGAGPAYPARQKGPARLGRKRQDRAIHGANRPAVEDITPERYCRHAPEFL